MNSLLEAPEKGKPQPGKRTSAGETGLHLTDLGNAKRLVQQHGDDLRYCSQWGKWLVWDGKRWAIDRTEAVMRLAKQTVTSLYAEATEKLQRASRELQACGDEEGRREIWEKALAAAKALGKWAVQSESAPRLNAMVQLAASEEGLAILPDNMDRDPMLICVRNGTVDLRTGELRPHRRADLLTKLAPVAFDPSATAPQWLQFMNDVFAGNAGLIEYLQRLLGYCLSASVGEQILPIFWGAGANGKSTLLNTFMAVLGPEYSAKAAPDLLMARRGETHPTERADLFGRRFVVALETEDGRKLAEALVKDLTGGDRQRARRMREDFWEFDQTAKIVLATNHKPEVRGTDHGIWRRIRLIPFGVIFPEDRQDKQLVEKLRGELPGILAWCVEGCLAWQRDGLGMPGEVKAATAAYRNDQDVLGAFLSECCFVGPDYRVKPGELYAAYAAWCKRSGEREVNQRRFGRSMTERPAFERYKSSCDWYRGVALRRDDESDSLPD